MNEEQGEPLPPRPPAMPPPRRRRPLVAFGTIAAIVAVLLLLAGALIRLPYVLIAPGTASSVERVVKVMGAPAYAHRGQLLFLTVSVSSDRPNAFAVLSGWLDDACRNCRSPVCGRKGACSRSGRTSSRFGVETPRP